MTFTTDKMTAALVVAALLAGCSSESSGKSRPPAATAGTAATTGTAAGWVDALARCVPGSKFSDCQTALTAAGVKLLPPRARTPQPHLWFGLEDPWDTVYVEGDTGAANRVVLLKIQSSMKPGKQRRQLVEWFNSRLKADNKDASAPNTGCGADGGGSSWKFAGEGAPEVQYAIETHPRLESAEGRNMDDYFVKTKSDINLCFFLPPSEKGGYVPSPVAAPVMTEFLRSPLFKDTHLAR